VAVAGKRQGGQEATVRRAAEDVTRLGARRLGGAGGVKNQRRALHFLGGKMKVTKDEWSRGVAPQSLQKVKSDESPSAIPDEAKVACPKRTSQIAL
jgi:hypothetical protein